MELHYGKPEHMEGRQEREIRTYEYLDSLGIEYWQTDHDNMAANTMEDCKEVDAILDATICKNLFLCNRQKTNFYVLMMPGDKPFKTKEISGQIQSARLSFAPEEKMLEYLDILPGAVSVLGLMNDHDNNIQLLVDEDVLEGEFLGCHPCVNTSSMKIRTKDVFEKFLPSVHHDFRVVHLTGEA
ncbi:MAG: prolyl-tRNA synthetase associated domain-containing protein [Eubacteriales bacterium]|nr:prolyl-tRNA synthetase associated domain-containing protein [Eubacteriales bacterium]